MLIGLLLILRRILVTKWIGEAWERYTTDPTYEDTIFKCFQRTGCLLTADGSDDNEVRPMQGMTDYVLPVVSQDWVIQNIIDNIVDEIAQDGFKLLIDAVVPDAQNCSEDELVLDDDDDNDILEEGESDDEDDCDWISCKDEMEVKEGKEYSYIGQIFHDKAKKEADGSINPFVTGKVVDIMRNNADDEDLHLYFKYFNHEASDGKQPTDSEEDEDKWGYTGCIEMMKTGKGASFKWPHLRC